MYSIALLVGLTLASNGFANGNAAYPFDVRDFIDRREMCDHFRGEEPYDEDRAAFLAKRIEQTCRGTDDELRKLKQKYNDCDKIIELLSRFEKQIESKNAL
jgi:hypothetical protein